MQNLNYAEASDGNFLDIMKIKKQIREIYKDRMIEKVNLNKDFTI